MQQLADVEFEMHAAAHLAVHDYKLLFMVERDGGTVFGFAPYDGPAFAL